MKLKTHSGNALHSIGIGTWGFGGSWEAEYGKEEEYAEAIRYSISKGQNHIDSGQIYGAGHTDEVIGQAIAGLAREDLYIGDKVWETHVAKGRVRTAVELMLKKLGTDYIDLLYIHKPWEDFPWREAVPQINELIDEGVVRQFGVSNFNLVQMQEAMKLSKHPVAANELYFNLLHKQEVTDEMKVFCKTNGIQIIAYRPLERGQVLENKVVQKVASSAGATAAQVALAWLLHQGAMVIPQATDKELIDQNIAATKLKLSPTEIEQLDKL